MALNYVTLILDGFDGGSNTLGQGAATFTPSVQLTDPTDHEWIPPAPVQAFFRAGLAAPQVSLLATDNANVLPGGWGWTVTFQNVPGNPASFTFFLPFANGATQYLSAQQPAQSVTAMQAYMPLPSGTPQAGQVPVATGTGEASAWGSASGGGAVSSVFGRTGAVTAQSGDYTATQVGADASGAAATAQASAQSYADTNKLAKSANLSDVANAATALTHLGGAALAGAAFTGEVTVQTPVNPGDATPKSYVDAMAAGLSVKASAQVATAAALPSNTYANGSSGVGATLTATANGALTVDGVAVASGNRVLVQNEATAANNGIYTVTNPGSAGAAYVLTRTTDMNTGTQFPGAFCFVEAGTANGGAGFVIASEGPFTVGTTAVNWSEFTRLPIPIPIADGGTNATTAASALTNLGALAVANNLSDLNNAATGRVNLGLAWKDPVQQAAFSALPANTYASGPQTLTATANGVLVVDGVTCVATQRVLVAGEATAQNNGIYVVTQAGDASHPYILTRSADMSTGSQVTGAMVMVEQGTAGAGSGWFMEGAGPDTIGTTALFWTKVTQIISGSNPQPNGTAAAGTSGFVSDSAHVHPAGSWQPADQGILAASFPPEVAGANTPTTAGTLYLIKVQIRAAITWTNVWFHVASAGAGASTGSYVGLYNSSGTLLTGSSDMGGSLTVTGIKTIALTTPQALSAGTFVWVAILTNLATTQPSILKSGTFAAAVNANLTAATARMATNGTSLTSLPASITPSSNGTSSNNFYWVAAT